MRSILITGVSGLLGSNLAFGLRTQYDVFGLYRTNEPEIEGCVLARCDVLHERCFRDAVAMADPDLIIHCAAMSSVDECQRSPDEARRQIVEASEIVARVAETTSVKLVTISTDSVYSDKGGPHPDRGETEGPLNEYGKLKLESERMVTSISSSALVLRTNFFGWAPGSRLSLAEWFLRALREKSSVSGFTDALFSSIYTGEMVVPLLRAVERDLAGVYNFGTRDGISKYKFGCLLAEYFGHDADLIAPHEMKGNGLGVPRSRDLRMNMSLLERDLDYRMPTVEQSIHAFYRDSFSLDKVKCPGFRREAKVIPYGKHQILRSDMKAVEGVLQSSLITQGPKVDEFEESFAELCGAKHAVACCNGTAALHLAMLAARVGPGDRVVTTPNTFLASANSAAFVGATPDFADIDPISYCLCPDSLEENWKKDTKAVVAVDFAGQPAEMPRIADIARRHGAFVIEDGCHAIGGRFSFNGSEYRVGGHPWADMTTFSFHPVKTVTSGEGGMVVTDDDELAERMRLLRTHGMVRDSTKFTHFNTAGDPINESQAWQLYEMQELGFNFRLSDVHAALGLSQLGRLAQSLQVRREIVQEYNQRLAGISFLDLPEVAPWLDHERHSLSWHLYACKVDFDALNLSRAEFMNQLKDEGVGVQAHYLPVHLQPYYRKRYGFQGGEFPVAESFGRRCLSFPLFPDPSIVDSVVKAINTTASKL